MESIGNRLKKIRMHEDLNQEAFANKYKTNQRAISRYEADGTTIPDEMKVMLYKNGYNLNWLITGHEEMIREKGNQNDVDNTKALLRKIISMNHNDWDILSLITQSRLNNNEKIQLKKMIKIAIKSMFDEEQ